MKKVKDINDWKMILDHLMTVEPYDNLKKMRASILNSRGINKFSSPEVVIAKKSTIGHHELSKREVLAVYVCDLIGGQAYKDEQGDFFFFDYKINSSDLMNNRFLDGLKLVDMEITNSFPTQIEDYDRNWGYPSIIRAAREGKIELSDSKLSLTHENGSWAIAGASSSSKAIVKSLENFNEVFYDSINSILDSQKNLESGMAFD
ncbi:hypothetical protein [Psychromonas sp. SP041]|uniref:hypothetical protein n=1 Tax=Psychromonas sp. SP041 TaxID=1365007 RepID=UPI00040968B6|nr:hypothetical protein [Psychromonas sp. SP041]